MRYWTGSIALSPTQDYPLLRQVLRSTFVTHRQLYELLKLDYHAHSRNAFNNRVLRLVTNKYLVRDEIPYRTQGYVYSISGKGASELIGLVVNSGIVMGLDRLSAVRAGGKTNIDPHVTLVAQTNHCGTHNPLMLACQRAKLPRALSHNCAERLNETSAH